MRDGLYRATVAAINDPRGQNRVRLRVPAVFGPESTGWATPMMGAKAPDVGERVWAAFEAGDESRPVYFSETAGTGIAIQPEPPENPDIDDLWLDTDEPAVTVTTEHNDLKNLSVGDPHPQYAGATHGHVATIQPASALPSSHPLGVSVALARSDDGWPEAQWGLATTERMNSTDGRQTYTAITGTGVGQTYIRVTNTDLGDAWSGWLKTSADGHVHDIATAARRSEQLLMLHFSRTFSWNGSRLQWPNRIIALGAGRGSHWAENGWFGFYVPADGTVIPGYGGAPSTAVDAEGISIPDHTALYGVPTIGGTSGETSLALVGYTVNPYVVPDHWVLIAHRSESGGTLRLGTGQTIDHWRSAALVNAWENYGTSWHPASYMKDADGFVHLRGLIRNGTNGHVFTLPVGYRTGLGATTNMHFLVRANTGAVGAYVNGAGEVIMNDTTPAWQDLASITPFRAEA